MKSKKLFAGYPANFWVGLAEQEPPSSSYTAFEFSCHIYILLSPYFEHFVHNLNQYSHFSRIANGARGLVLSRHKV